jgi:hypothetical protein
MDYMETPDERLQRQEFELWLDVRHDLASEWQPSRNCFKDFPAHLAWCAWRESRQRAGAVQMSVISFPSRLPWIAVGAFAGVLAVFVYDAIAGLIA